MTKHLDAGEHSAALDGTLPAARLAHLETCEACRSVVDAHREIVAVVLRDDVPEPSPLFWDHFSARVRNATASVPPSPGLRWSWRVWTALASAAVTAAVVVVVRLELPRAVPAPAPATSTAAIAAEGTDAAEPWSAVVQVASELSADDVHGLVQSGGDSSLLVEELNPAERAAFVRLLHDEMERHQ